VKKILDDAGRVAEERECPFAGVAVPVPVRDDLGQPIPGRHQLAMQRAACSASCALYDKARDLTCLDRLEALFAPPRVSNERGC